MNPPRTATTRSRKIPKTFRLDPERITAAQRVLGTATATETIETALDLVLFRDELVSGTRAMRGAHIVDADAPEA